MCACQVCGTDDRTEVMRILNAVQQKDKWRLPFLLCAREDVLNGCITVGSNLCNDTLMLSCGGQLIKTLFFYVVDDGIVFFRLADDRADRAVLAACKDEQLVHGLAGAERLDDSVSSLYHAACKLLIRLLYFLFSVSVTVISFPLKVTFFSVSSLKVSLVVSVVFSHIIPVPRSQKQWELLLFQKPHCPFFFIF